MAENIFNEFRPKASEDNPFAEFAPAAAVSAAPAPAEPKPKSSVVRRVLGDTAVDLGRGVIGVGEAAVGLANIPTFGGAGKGLEAIGYRPDVAKDMIGELYSPERKAAQEQVDQAEGFVGTAKSMLQNPSTIAGAVVESLPAMVGGGAVAQGLRAVRGLGTVARAAIGEGAVGAGQSAEGIRQQTEDGMLSAGQVGAAVGSGLGTAALGAAGGALARRLGIADVDVALAGGNPATAVAPGRNVVDRTLRGAASGALAEGLLEEMPQSAQEQAWQNLALDRPVGEGVAGAAAAGLLTGAAMGGPVGAVSAARPRRTLPSGADVPDPANGPLSRVVADAAATGALDRAEVQKQAAAADARAASGEIDPALLEKGNAALPGADQRPIDTRALDRPWVDESTGVDRAPTDDEIRASVRGYLEAVADAGTRSSRKHVVASLGLGAKRVNAVIDDILAERKRAATTPEAPADVPAPAAGRTEPAGSGVDGAVDAGGRAGEPAGVPAGAADAVAGQPAVAGADPAGGAPDAGAPAAPGQRVAPPANAGMFERIAAERARDEARRQEGEPAAAPANLDPSTGELLGIDAEAWPAAAEHQQPSAIVQALKAGAARNKNRPDGITRIADTYGIDKDTARALRNRAISEMQAEAGSARRADAPAAAQPAASTGEGPEAPQGVTYDDSNDVLDTDIGAPSGGPFTIRDAADREAARTEGGRVFPVEGGFVVRTPQAPTAPEATASTSQGIEGSSTPPRQEAPSPKSADAALGQASGRTDAVPTPPPLAAASPASANVVGTEGGQPAPDTPLPEAAQTLPPAAEGTPSTRLPAQDPGGAAPAGLDSLPSAQATPAAPAEQIAARANEAATSPANDLPEPSTAQKDAGNYRKGHVRLNGHDISIENPAGSKRNPKWPAIKDHYGYIRGTVGKDKDHVDVFLTDRAHEPELPVFVVDQVNKDGIFDEHKVVMGATDEANARETYLRNYSKGWTGLGAITQMTQDEFKAWVRDQKRTRRPAGKLAKAASPVAEAPSQAPDAAAPAAPAPRPKVRTVNGRKRYQEGHPDTIRAFFQPGAMVPSYGGTDRVLGLDIDESGAWSARVIAVNADGSEITGERERRHSTVPEHRDIVKVLGKAKDQPPARRATKKKVEPATPAAPETAPAPDARRLVNEGPNGVRVGDRVMVADERTGPREMTVTAIEINAPPAYKGTAFKVARDDATPDGRGTGWVGIDRITPRKAPPALTSSKDELSDADFEANLPAYVAQYGALAEREAGNPDYFNADLAKELFPEYNASNEARRDNNEKVASRASKIAFTAFEQRLAQPVTADDGGVTLMAGGTGSGKSSLKPDSGIVYDSTMYDTAAARRNVEKVLASGRVVKYRYVFTTPESAFRAAVARGKDVGRYVNMTAFVRTHEGAFRAAGDLMAAYADDARVVFKLYDNTDFAQRSIESLPEYDYNQLRERLQATLDAEVRAGRIDEAEYRAIAGTDAPRALLADVRSGREANPDGGPEQGQGLVDPQTPPTGGVSASGTTDAGEELWYNRRNRSGNGLQWADVEALNDTLKVKEVVKSKVWPRPNYEQLVADGLRPEFAHVVKQVYDSLATKPQVRGVPTDAQLQAYIETVGKVRDVVFDFVRDNARVGGALNRAVRSATAMAGGSVIDLATSGTSGDANLLDAVFPAERAGANRWRGAGGPNENNARANLIGGNKPVRALQIDSGTFQSAVKAVGDGWPTPQEAWQRLYKFNKYSSGYAVSRGGRTIARELPTQTAADEAAKAHYEQSRKTGEGAMAVEARAVEEAQRTGPAHRRPDEDISSERLMQSFGFRGVNFGNWMKGDSKAKVRERQLHLNHAYDALMDLSDITGLPPRALSLEGKLGIAFGAQGSGGRGAAHFVPGLNEINLTRTSGAGGIAHEWAHALDHYFAVQAGDDIARSADPFLTQFSMTKRTGMGVRPEIAKAFQKIVNNMRDRPLTDDEVREQQEGWARRLQGMLDRPLTALRARLQDDEAAAATFDELAARLRTGDTGEGQVETGRKVASALNRRVKIPETVSQVGGQMLGLLREHGMSVPEVMQYLPDAEAAARLIATQAQQSEASQAHVPQSGKTQTRSEYMKESMALESKAARTGAGKRYWSTPWEQFARAFESFVVDRLASGERRSDYLSWPQMTEEGAKALKEAGLIKGDMYPRGAERTRIGEGFDTLLAEIKTEDTADGNVRLFSKATGVRGDSTLSMDDALRLKAKITGRWGENAPVVHLVESAEGFPASAKADPDYRRAEGLYEGKPAVWINVGGIATEKRFAEVLAHEALGHYGVESVVGAAEWTGIVSAIENHRRNGTGADSLKRAIRDVHRRYEQGGKLDPTTFAKEVIAVMAEQGARNGLLSRVVAAVRSWLRKHMPGLQWSDADVLGLLSAADGFLRAGRSQAESREAVAALAFSQREALSTFLRGEPVGEAGGDAFPRREDATLLDQVQAYFEGIGGTATNPQIGEVRLRRPGIKASIAHGIGRPKAAAFRLVPDVIEQGRLIDQTIDASGRSPNRHVIAAPVRVEGKDYLMGVVVRQQGGDPANFYLHEVTLTPKKEPRRSIETESRAEQANIGGPAGAIGSLLLDAYAGNRDTQFSRPPVQVQMDGRGDRRITMGGETFLEVGRRFYMVNGTGYPKDFTSLGAATEAAQRTGGEVVANTPIEGERPSWSVLVPDTAARAAGAERPLFSKAPADVLADIDAVMSDSHREGLVARAKQWLKDATPAKIKDELRGSWLGALTTRHLTELGQDYFQNIGHYSDFLARQQADRNKLASDAEGIAEGARKWAGKHRAEARRLFDLMHKATIDGTDPAEAYQPLQFEYGGKLYEATPKNVKDALRAIREQMLGRGGDNKKDMMAEAKRIREMPARERARRKKHPSLVEQWNQLSPEAQDIYRQFRDAYAQRSADVEQALIARINDTDAPENMKRRLINTIRMQFETQRLSGVYFPLQRFGRYFVAAEKDGAATFLMFERLADQERAVADLRKREFQITAQGLKSAGRAKDAPSGTFVAEIIEQLRKSGVSEQTQDQIYQLYLQTLPEMSMRKHSIHRKVVPGFDPDAIRAFAFNQHHGAHQLARLRWGHKMQNVLDLLKRQQDVARREPDADTRRIAAGDAILEELNKRDEWINNPQDSNLTNLISSAGFVYYLGLTPAAALVNLTQTAMVSYPYLAARYGPGKAMNALLKAGAAAGRTIGNIQNTLTDVEERQAHAVLQRMGAIDKTQAHNLAGIAEGGLAGYNPKWAKAMEIIGFAFHKTEVVNREATGMAAFRLARAAGETFEQAIKVAADTIYDTHFDYSNANRARFMQSGTAKVLLMFRQYSLNMTWHLARMVWQASKGQDKAVRALARRNLVGILGMTGIFAGALGLPLMKASMGILNAVAASAGGDDEPWDAETEFRAWLAELLGPAVAELILTGPTNALTGADIHSRVGLSDLWLRDADRELDGRGQYYHLLEQAAGPMGGVLKNALVGKGLIDEGHVWRGVETMLPKALKDMLKAARFSREGVNNLRGDPLVTDPNLWQMLLQFQGFTPAEVSRQYDTNRALRNYEQHILDRRQHLMNSLAMAYRLEDGEARAETMAQIATFNRTHPEIGITPASIRRSMQSRARYSARAEAGVVLNPKIASKIREQVGVEP